MFKRYYYDIYSCDASGVCIVSSLDGRPFYIHSSHIKRIVYNKPRYRIVMLKSIDFNDQIKYKLPCKIKDLD